MKMGLRMHQVKAEFKNFGWGGGSWVIKVQIVCLTKSCGWSSIILKESRDQKILAIHSCFPASDNLYFFLCAVQHLVRCGGSRLLIENTFNSERSVQKVCTA